MYDNHNEISQNLYGDIDIMNGNLLNVTHVNLNENQQTTRVKDINDKNEVKNDLEAIKNNERGRKRQMNFTASQINCMHRNFYESAFASGNNLKVSKQFLIDKNLDFVPKKVIQGSFHQGDIMFGENAVTQCVCKSFLIK